MASHFPIESPGLHKYKNVSISTLNLFLRTDSSKVTLRCSPVLVRIFRSYAFSAYARASTLQWQCGDHRDLFVFCIHGSRSIPNKIWRAQTSATPFSSSFFLFGHKSLPGSTKPDRDNTCVYRHWFCFPGGV